MGQQNNKIPLKNLLTYLANRITGIPSWKLLFKLKFSHTKSYEFVKISRKKIFEIRFTSLESSPCSCLLCVFSARLKMCWRDFLRSLFYLLKTSLIAVTRSSRRSQHASVVGVLNVAV